MSHEEGMEKIIKQTSRTLLALQNKKSKRASL